jgi:hypothetical protein
MARRTLRIPDDWAPTSDNINALPEPLRRYIMELHTLCDPQLIIQQNWELRDLVAALEAMVLRLKRERPAASGETTGQNATDCGSEVCGR